MDKGSVKKLSEAECLKETGQDYSHQSHQGQRKRSTLRKIRRQDPKILMRKKGLITMNVRAQQQKPTVLAVY